MGKLVPSFDKPLSSKKIAFLDILPFQGPRHLVFLTKYRVARNLAPCVSVLKKLVKYLKELVKGFGKISIIGPNCVHQRMNHKGNWELKSLSNLTNQEWVIIAS